MCAQSTGCYQQQPRKLGRSQFLSYNPFTNWKYKAINTSKSLHIEPLKIYFAGSHCCSHKDDDCVLGKLNCIFLNHLWYLCNPFITPEIKLVHFSDLCVNHVPAGRDTRKQTAALTVIHIILWWCFHRPSRAFLPTVDTQEQQTVP